MTPAQPAGPFAVGSLMQLTLSLLLIVGLILGLSWVLRRLRPGGVRSRGGIAVIDELAIGPRERIVLVGIGGAQVLIGVAANGIVRLEPLAQPLDLQPAGAAPPAFAEKLRELMKRTAGQP